MRSILRCGSRITVAGAGGQAVYAATRAGFQRLGWQRGLSFRAGHRAAPGPEQNHPGDEKRQGQQGQLGCHAWALYPLLRRRNLGGAQSRINIARPARPAIFRKNHCTGWVTGV